MDEKLYLIDLDCYARADEKQKKKVKESHCFDFGLLPTKGLELPNNEESQRLAKRLQEVSYITSYKLQEKEVYDSVTETKKKKSTFVCWIKAIKG